MEKFVQHTEEPGYLHTYRFPFHIACHLKQKRGHRACQHMYTHNYKPITRPMNKHLMCSFVCTTPMLYSIEEALAIYTTQWVISSVPSPS